MHLFGVQPIVLWSDLLIYVRLLGGGLWLYFALRRGNDKGEGAWDSRITGS